MRKKLQNQYFLWGLTAFLVIAASILFCYILFKGANIRTGLKTVSNIFMPVIFSLVTSYLLTPVLNFLEARVMIPFCDKVLQIKASQRRAKAIRMLATMLTVILFVLLIYEMFALLLSQIVPSVQNIVSNSDTYINNFSLWLDKLLADNPDIRDYVMRMVGKYSEELETWINDTLLTKSSQIIKTVSLSVIGILKVLWNFILGFVISIYLLFSKERFTAQSKKVIYAFFERNMANRIISNLRFTHRTFTGFVSGKIFDSIIIGILCFIGTSIMKTPYAALVSLIIGLTNVIPFFGPYMGAIPTIILIFVVNPSEPLNCVYFALFILALQQFDGNVLGPKILGNSTGLSGFWVIFAITVFGGLFGVIGMIIGVPIFAVLYAAFKTLIEASLDKKKIPRDTTPYLKVGAVDESGFFHPYTGSVKNNGISSKTNRRDDNALANDNPLTNDKTLTNDSGTREESGDRK